MAMMIRESIVGEHAPVTTVPRYTVYAVAAVLVSTVGVVGLLSWHGVDIGPVTSFLAGFLPSTIASLIAVRQNEKLLGTQQEIRTSVNGNLSRLIELANANHPAPPDPPADTPLAPMPAATDYVEEREVHDGE